MKVNVGDRVIRMLAGTVPMPLKVTNIENGIITCGGKDGWTFDEATGAEIDEELGWGPPPLRTGSFLLQPDES